MVWTTILFFAMASLAADCCLVESCAMAQSSQCELIRNADRRNMCRALSTGKAIYCESIKDSDLRHECRARVKK